MYIVRRSFRAPTKIMSAGSVIHPADIPDFNYRLKERHIVKVTEQNFLRYKYFFKERYNIEIPALPAKVPALPVENATITIIKGTVI